MVDRLAGVVLMCTDTEAARAWYEAIGFSHLRGHDGMHWMGIGTCEVMLHPADSPSGASGMTLQVVVDSVQAAFDRAVAAGIAPCDHQQPGIQIDGPVTRPWGAVEFELDDPDGHRWCFTETHGS